MLQRRFAAIHGQWLAPSLSSNPSPRLYVAAWTPISNTASAFLKDIFNSSHGLSSTFDEISVSRHSIQVAAAILTMPGKILAHVDCASPYSYFALVHLRRIRPLLETYNVEIEFIPVFLGGINHATGNKPPSTLPARGKYGPYDMRRAIEHFGTAILSAPPFFPMVSLLPQRCMCAIKSSYPREVYEQIFERLWVWVFNKHVDLAKTDNMKAVLLDGGELTEPQVDQILAEATTKQIKAELNENTRKAIEEYGAYGAPWLWVVKTDDSGQELLAEPVFGSDRFTYVYRMLGLKFEDVKLLPRQGDAKL